MLLLRPCLCGKVMSAHKWLFSNVFWENRGSFPILLQWESKKENCVYPENERTEQQHSGGACDRLPASFVEALWTIQVFLKVKNLSQPYYISAMPARLQKSTLQPSSVESTQARQDDSWLAAVFTRINYVVHELKLTPTLSVRQIRCLIVCGCGQGHLSNFSLHNSQTRSNIWVFFSEQKLFFWRERASRHFVRLIKSNSAANVRNYKRIRLV